MYANGKKVNLDRRDKRKEERKDYLSQTLTPERVERQQESVPAALSRSQKNLRNCVPNEDMAKAFSPRSV